MHIIYVSYVWWNEKTNSAPRSYATIGPDRRSCVPWGFHGDPMGIPLGQAAPGNRTEGAQCGNSETESLGPVQRFNWKASVTTWPQGVPNFVGESTKSIQKCEERLLYTSLHCLHTLWNFETVHFFLTCDHPLLCGVCQAWAWDRTTEIAWPFPFRRLGERWRDGWMVAGWWPMHHLKC